VKDLARQTPIVTNPQPPGVLEKHFADCRDVPGDMQPYFDVLRRYASQCDHVTEFGVRTATGSTVALLAGQPGELISWDIDPAAVLGDAVRGLAQPEVLGRTRFQPRTGDSSQITIEETDFLFIDSLHTSEHLTLELKRHGNRVRKWIGFHDTWLYGYKDERGNEPGLRMVIRWFQRNHAFPLWKLVADHKSDAGLAIIERIDVR
jgi:hypothetical protein